MAWSPEAFERALDMFYDPPSGGISWSKFMHFAATRGGMCLQHRNLICPLCVVIRECAYPKCPCLQYTESTVFQHQGMVRARATHTPLLQRPVSLTHGRENACNLI